MICRGAAPKSAKRCFANTFDAIKAECGYDDRSRYFAGKPLIRLSEGKTLDKIKILHDDGRTTLEEVAFCNLRKTAANIWEEHVSASAATYMLKHSVAAQDGVSETTRKHYIQKLAVLKSIVPAIETLPIW
ncbi:MAG: hypothetical protein IPL86_19210 [Flavobacteriales bacterium]|nr:hypothetical protein [Flavobacteriales bacterium]